MQRCFKTLFRFGLCALLAATLWATPRTVLASGPDPVVIFETSMGRVIVMLTPRQTPVTVQNFLRYVNEGFYDGTIIHRIVKQPITGISDRKRKLAINIVQGGGYSYPPRMKRPLWGPIPNEATKGLQNDKGTIAMARGNDPNSAAAQFFFNVEDNPYLNPAAVKKQWGEEDEFTMFHGYTVFGRVIRGMDVVEKIHGVNTKDMPNLEGFPVDPVFVKRVYVAK